MKPTTRADLLAVEDAKQRIADGLRRGDTWFRSNPWSGWRHGVGRAAGRRSGYSSGRPAGAVFMLATRPAGRNAPCPCGCGQKYKRCAGPQPNRGA